MSNLVLRNLMLPEDSVLKYSNTSATAIVKGLALDNTQTVEENATADSLNYYDSFTFSTPNQPSTKGRVPIQLTLSPDEITASDLIKNTTKNTGAVSQITALNGLNKSEKPVTNYTENKPATLKPLPNQTSTSYNASFNSSVTTSYSQISEGKKVIGSSYATSSGSVTTSVQSFSFVDNKDETMDKLNVAIEKINNWDRKVRALDSLVENSGNAVTSAFKSALLDSSSQVKDARKKAIDSRKEAITSYNDAILELKAKFNTSPNSYFSSSSNSNLYKTTYDTMENLFKATQIKDQTTMEKVKSYLKTAFNYVLDIANPFAY